MKIWTSFFFFLYKCYLLLRWNLHWDVFHISWSFIQLSKDLVLLRHVGDAWTFKNKFGAHIFNILPTWMQVFCDRRKLRSSARLWNILETPLWVRSFFKAHPEYTDFCTVRVWLLFVMNNKCWCYNHHQTLPLWRHWAVFPSIFNRQNEAVHQTSELWEKKSH